MALHSTSGIIGQAGGSTPFARRCALCQTQRLTGGLLPAQPGAGEDALWVCDDCQHKLARRVDDEGALGG